MAAILPYGESILVPPSEGTIMDSMRWIISTPDAMEMWQDQVGDGNSMPKLYSGTAFPFDLAFGQSKSGWRLQRPAPVSNTGFSSATIIVRDTAGNMSAPLTVSLTQDGIRAFTPFDPSITNWNWPVQQLGGSYGGTYIVEQPVVTMDSHPVDSAIFYPINPASTTTNWALQGIYSSLPTEMNASFGSPEGVRDASVTAQPGSTNSSFVGIGPATSYFLPVYNIPSQDNTSYTPLVVSPVDNADATGARHATPAIITIPPTWQTNIVNVPIQVQDQGIADVQTAGSFTATIGLLQTLPAMAGDTSSLTANLPLVRFLGSTSSSSLGAGSGGAAVAANPGLVSATYYIGTLTSATPAFSPPESPPGFEYPAIMHPPYQSNTGYRWYNFIRLNPDQLVTGNQTTVRIEAGFINGRLTASTFDAMGDYVHFLSNGNDITQVASAYDPSADPSTRAGLIAIAGQRLVAAGANASLVQAIELDLVIAPDVPAGILDVDVKCGAVMAYTDTLSAQYAGSNGAHRMKQSLKIYSLILDIDSDNNNGFNPPDRTPEERQFAHYNGDPNHPGKIFLVNDGDIDGDGVIDYADGYNLSNGLISDDAQSPGVQFVPVVLEVGGDISASAMLKIGYDASDPLKVAGDFTRPFIPPIGHLRLWTLNGGQPRNGNTIKQGGNFIPSGTYQLSDLGISANGGTVTLYLEGIREIEITGSLTICVSLDPQGNGNFLPSAYVNVHPIRMEITGKGMTDVLTSDINGFIDTEITQPPPLPDDGTTGLTFNLIPINTQVVPDDQTSSSDAASIEGGGFGLSGISDSIALYGASVFGQCEIRGRLGALTGGSNSLAGVTIRESADPSDVFVAIESTGTDLQVFSRSQYGQQIQTLNIVGDPSNQLRIIRSGNQLTCSLASNSSDLSGTIIASFFIPLSDPVLTGLTVSSGDEISIAEAQFSDFIVNYSGNTDPDDTTAPSVEIPGSYLEQKILFYDPRNTTMTTTIDGSQVNLYRDLQLNALTSDPFLAADSGPTGVSIPTNDPSIVVNQGDVQIDYNFIIDPGGIVVTVNPTASDTDVANAIEKIVKNMKSSNWTPATDGYLVTDSGAFGKGVHSRMAQFFQGKGGWFAELYVNTTTLKIVPTPIPNVTTNIDLMRTKGGYIPKIGSILDQSMIEDIYEIKTSIGGKVNPDQLDRLKIVRGGNIKVTQAPQRWTAARNWSPNPKYARIFKLLSLIALADCAYNIVNASDNDQDIENISQACVAIRTKLDTGGFDDGLEYFSAVAEVHADMFEYLKRFTGNGTAVNLIEMASIYKILLSDEFQDQYGGGEP
jgi:hypothetical protein